MKRIFILFLAGVATSATALPSFTGKIKSYLTGYNYQGRVFIDVDDSIRSYTKNDCQSNSNDFGFDATSEQGKTYLSIVMAAHAANKTVTITGFSTCNVYNGVTDLRSIQVNN